jgi:hypothetical protein
MKSKQEFKEAIKLNIQRYGHHINLVSGGNVPRYGYTIGLCKTLGFELVIAGAIIYMKDELYMIVNCIAEILKKQEGEKTDEISVYNLGRFSLSTVDSSWSNMMMLGVFDYYGIESVKAFQIKPDIIHSTLDIPDMTRKWDPSSEPVWQWLNSEWSYPVPKHSQVITNLDALQGYAVSELMRWETDEWEMFSGAGPEIEKDQIRVVPLGLMLGIDRSLEAALNVPVGKGLWREAPTDKWNTWG